MERVAPAIELTSFSDITIFLNGKLKTATYKDDVFPATAEVLLVTQGPHLHHLQTSFDLLQGDVISVVYFSRRRQRTVTQNFTVNRVIKANTKVTLLVELS